VIDSSLSPRGRPPHLQWGWVLQDADHAGSKNARRWKVRALPYAGSAAILGDKLNSRLIERLARRDRQAARHLSRPPPAKVRQHLLHSASAHGCSICACGWVDFSSALSLSFRQEPEGAGIDALALLSRSRVAAGAALVLRVDPQATRAHADDPLLRASATSSAP
jgi:hypothetical protein